MLRKRPLASLLSISPFIAPHAVETCHALSLYGGGVLGPTGDVGAVAYRRKEGIYIPRLVHVEYVDTGAQQVFVLDEVTGEYTHDALRLWPLAPEAVTRLPDVYLHLGPDVTWVVEQFLDELLPVRRPGPAHHDQLRQQILWRTADRHAWVAYWTAADLLQKKRVPTQRIRTNIWAKRKMIGLLQKHIPSPGSPANPIVVD
jgi:hypothetical protein